VQALELSYLSIAEASRAIQAKELSPVELTTALLDRIAAIDPKLNAPSYRPEPVEWRDDPDPFGLDWEWAEPERGPKLENHPVAPEGGARQRPARAPFRYPPMQPEPPSPPRSSSRSASGSAHTQAVRGVSRSRRHSA